MNLGGEDDAEHDLIEAMTTPVPHKPKKRIRQSAKPLLNKLETEFYGHLQQITCRQIFAQALRFRLGNGIWYKPDFVVFNERSRTAAYEVKGPHAFRGGYENLKVAAGLYLAITFFLVWKENGTWQEQEILP